MIIYFSGNGNSAHVAHSLSELLGDERTVRLEANLIKKNKIDLTGDLRLVWVFPIHAWGMPKAVCDFMKNVEIVGDIAEQYMVVTCGDDTGYVDREWRKIMRQRGYKSSGCWHVIMPNTFVTLPGFDVDSQEVEKNKIANAAPRIKEIYESITAKSEETDINRGYFAWIKSYVLRPLFLSKALDSKPFLATDACISCGECERNCPLSNIKLSDKGKPAWGADCTLCLGCYNCCPRHAIEYGRVTLHKGQYHFGKRP